MARCSNKQVAKILASGIVVEGRANEEDIELNRKIALVTSSKKDSREEVEKERIRRRLCIQKYSSILPLFQ
jgi:hypothetical protein